MMEIVHDKPKWARIINIEGKKGESLFYRPLTWAVEKDIQLISELFAKYKKLVEKAKDERLLALIGALSVEEALGSFLNAYIPHYDGLEDNRDFGLSIKIDLAHSLRLIPEHILNAADVVRKIRNEFVHDLSIDCFDSLDDKYKNKVRARFKEFLPEDTNTSLILKDMFVHVVEGVIMGLEIYASHLKAAKEYIYGEDFYQQLVTHMKSKSG